MVNILDPDIIVLAVEFLRCAPLSQCPPRLKEYVSGREADTPVVVASTETQWRAGAHGLWPLGALNIVIPVAYPFRVRISVALAKSCCGKETLRPEGLSYKGKKTPRQLAEGVRKTFERVYASNWLAPQQSSANGEHPANQERQPFRLRRLHNDSCTDRQCQRCHVCVTTSKLFRLIVP